MDMFEVVADLLLIHTPRLNRKTWGRLPIIVSMWT